MSWVCCCIGAMMKDQLVWRNECEKTDAGERYAKFDDKDVDIWICLGGKMEESEGSEEKQSLEL